MKSKCKNFVMSINKGIYMGSLLLMNYLGYLDILWLIVQQFGVPKSASIFYRKYIYKALDIYNETPQEVLVKAINTFLKYSEFTNKSDMIMA